MLPAAVLYVNVLANTSQATRGILRFNTTLKATEATSNKALGAVSALAKGAAFGAAGGIAYAVKKAADFEQQLDSLGAVSDATGRQMEQLRQQAMKAGAATKFSALDAAEAQTELAKGGLKVKQIMRGGLRAALALAAAGEMELADAAATTANAMNLFGLKGKSAMKVADQLATAANATTADVSDFAMALQQGGSVAKIAGLSFKETVLALEALAKSGIKNSDAGTSMKTAFIQLLKPSAKQAELADKLGLNFVSAAGNMKDMADISTMLRAKLGDMTNAQRAAALATLAGTDGVRTLTALYAAGPDKLNKWSVGLAKTGTAAEVAAKKQDNLKGKLENLQGSVETIAIAFGSKLLPGLTKAAEKITDILNDPKLTSGQKFDKFADMVTKAISDGLNKAAKLAEQIAPKVAAAFARGWFNAPIWTKLLVGGFLLSKMGGTKAFLALGAVIGRAMGLGMASGAASAMTGGAAAGGGAAAAGGLLGGMRGKLLPLAKRAGLAGVGIALADGVISEFGRRSQERGPDMFKALEAARKPTSLLGVNRSNFIGAKVIGDLGGEGERIKNANKLAAALQDIADKAKAISPKRAMELRMELGRLDDVSGEARKGINQLIDGAVEKGRKIGLVRSEFGRFRSGAILDVKQLRKETSSQFTAIAELMGTKSKAGRQALNTQFHLSLDVIKDFKRRGIINVAEAGDQIRFLMKSRTKQGKDALASNMLAAEKAIAATMSRGGKVTAQGTALIRALMVSAMQDMGLSPDTIRMSLNKRESAKHGPVTPGQTGLVVRGGKPHGDSVHAVLERGEVVINRKAVQKMGGPRAVNTINQKIPRFQTGGIAGMVGAANQLERAHFAYKWGGGHQGSPAPFGPMDCSGAVSYVLQHGGVPIPTMVSGALAGAGQAGPGPVTVFANSTHTFMRLGRRYFGTSGSNPGGGAGWMPDPGAGYRSRFAERHFDAKGFTIPRLLVNGPNSLVKTDVQGALDNTRRGGNRRLRNVLFTPVGSGDAGDPGPDARGTGSRGSSGTRSHGFQRGGIVGFPKTPINVAANAAGKAGFRAQTWPNMVAISGRETGGTWNPRATNFKPPDHSIGLWQINQLAHKGRFGTDAQLMDPYRNGRAAKSLFDASGYSPWVGVNYGGASQYLGQAHAAVAAVSGAKGKARPGKDRPFDKKPFKGSLGKVLTKTLKVLRSNKSAKVRGGRLRQFEARLHKDLGLPPKLENALKFLSASATISGDYADKASQLNVDNGDGTTTLGLFRGHDEPSWLTDQLGALFAWRNKIIDAVKVIEKRRKEVAGLLARARKRLASVAETIRKVAKGRKAITDQIEKLKKHPKRNKAQIDALTKQGRLIDAGQKPRVRERKLLTDRIIPALSGRGTALKEQYGTLIGSEGLEQVQGPGGPLTRLKKLPPLGVLGGSIFDVQLRLRDLAAPPQAATDNSPVTGESLDAIKQLLRESNLRTAVSETLFKTLGDFKIPGYPFLGSFEKGGVFLAGEKGPELVHTASSGRVYNATDTQQMLQPNVNVSVVLFEGEDKALVDVNGRQVEAKVRRMARNAGRGLPSQGGG